MGMWMRILPNLDTTQLDQLALVNDSCVAIRPLDFMSTMTGFWGMCDSYEISHHIQSFFLVFEKNVLEHLNSFVQELATKIADHSDDKRIIIDSFEIGISTHMEKNGVPLNVVYEWSVVSSAANITSISPSTPRVNPSYYYWDRMLALGCPLLKKTRAHYENEIEFIKQYRTISYAVVKF
jgi:hypothetical protein